MSVPVTETEDEMEVGLQEVGVLVLDQRSVSHLLEHLLQRIVGLRTSHLC